LKTFLLISRSSWFNFNSWLNLLLRDRIDETMKSRNFGTLLLVLGAGLLLWAAYDYFAHPIIDASSCGVTVTPSAEPVSVLAFAKNRVPLKLVNRSGRPVRIVGNNAC
jgi:hypothetical protein